MKRSIEGVKKNTLLVTIASSLTVYVSYETVAMGLFSARSRMLTRVLSKSIISKEAHIAIIHIQCNIFNMPISTC